MVVHLIHPRQGGFTTSIMNKQGRQWRLNGKADAHAHLLNYFVHYEIPGGDRGMGPSFKMK